MKYFMFKNWHKYQHYKGRRPPWLKLYRDLLRDRDFMDLPETSRWHIIGLLMVACGSDNVMPYDMTYLRRELNAKAAIDFTRLFASGMLAWCGHDASPSYSEDILLQTDIQQETPPLKHPPRKSSKKTTSESPPEFEAFWEAYPRKIAKRQALKTWRKIIGNGSVSIQRRADIVKAAKNYKLHSVGKEPEVILHPSSFLGERLGQRWTEFVEAAPKEDKAKTVEQERVYEEPDWQKNRPKDWKAPK